MLYSTILTVLIFHKTLLLLDSDFTKLILDYEGT